MSRATRWAGVSATDRRAERRALLIGSAYALFGEGGEAAVSVRSICRESGLNTRYFYENFTDTNGLLGAVYDEVAAELGRVLAVALASARTGRDRVQAGIRAVLEFSSADPRRGAILFTEARANPVLSQRRTRAQDYLRELVFSDRIQSDPESDWLATEVGAAMYAGAMAELARQWLSGTLGTNLDVVVEHALRLVMPEIGEPI